MTEEKQISNSEKIDSYLYFSDHRVIYFGIPVILDDLSCNKYINRCISVDELFREATLWKTSII